MGDSQVLRLPCPHCQRVLKIPFAWAGKRGTCPACNKPIQFDKSLVDDVAQSKLGETIRSMLAESDEPLDEKAFDHITLLLSQGTCRDYKLVLSTLGDRKLSAKQWRRALAAAAARESMRHHIEDQLDRLPEIEEDEVTSLAVVDAPAAQDSWQIIARFCYYMKHDTCKKCDEDPTGLHCIYLNYADFVKARSISDERSQRWEKVAQTLLGL